MSGASAILKKFSKKQSRLKSAAKSPWPARLVTNTGWDRLSDEKLLTVRFCDLNLEIKGSWLENPIERLYDELKERKIRLKPKCWLSEEWFSPDNQPGIAIAFYLAHPRLKKLEERTMCEVEGGTKEWCMRLLRHEMGHCLDSAYRLHRRRKYKQMFGNSDRHYPVSYTPNPWSKRYVLHLGFWYAQSHPTEDFAETFAVWLRNPDPHKWQKRYQNWPQVLKKLHYVDELMNEIGSCQPLVVFRRAVDPLHRNVKTLGHHYAKKKRHYELEYPEYCDEDLCRFFVRTQDDSSKKSAARFLFRVRPKIRKEISRWTGEHPYIVDQVFKIIIMRCKYLRLSIPDKPKDLVQDTTLLLVVQTLKFLKEGCLRVAI
jgi:hypothetical protein